MSDDGTRRIKLLYFAWVRERIGHASEVVDLPQSIETVADLVSWLRGRGPQFELAFAQPELVRVAVNRVHVKPAAGIGGAQEVAFFPPVTGG